ncbi:MAG: hypothetical protein ACPGVZ_17240 [Myxococcota bacterium]
MRISWRVDRATFEVYERSPPGADTPGLRFGARGVRGEGIAVQILPKSASARFEELSTQVLAKL